MTPPQEEKEPKGEPLDARDAARHLVHLGMTPDSARTFANYVSGAYASFRPRT